MLLYAGYKECTVHLLAGMLFCYIYRQQGGAATELPHGRKDEHEGQEVRGSR